jgi:16S rRNA A1518/A1519 N6-dimethyltransferase RsmA/KsgA/DIM1 with predicted DNA glycosylase/AP lyase activity
MQTKRQIQRLLASAGVSPNKRLGQHFLIDLNLMRLLVDSAHISDNDIVLEAGCGTGSLTEALAEKAGYCLAVELDESIAKIAKGQLVKAENVEIINTDVLETKHTISRAVTETLELCQKNHAGRILLVANLPYSIACPSAMVSFIRNKDKLSRIANMELFSEVVNLFMGHRRKMLKTCTKLAQGQLAYLKNWPNIFHQANITPTQRPEQLDPNQYVTLSNICCERLQPVE